MPGRRRRREESSEEDEDPLARLNGEAEMLSCPFCGVEFRDDATIPQSERLPVKYLLTSHILTDHPEGDGDGADDCSTEDEVVPVCEPPAVSSKPKTAAVPALALNAPTQKIAVPDIRDADDDDDDDDDEPPPRIIAPAGSNLSEQVSFSNSQTVSQMVPELPVYDIPECVTLTVKLVGGTQQEHHVASDAVVKDVMTLISCEKGRPGEKARLIYHGREITNFAATLRDVGIIDPATVHYVAEFTKDVRPEVEEELRKVALQVKEAGARLRAPSTPQKRKRSNEAAAEQASPAPMSPPPPKKMKAPPSTATPAPAASEAQQSTPAKKNVAADPTHPAESSAAAKEELKTARVREEVLKRLACAIKGDGAVEGPGDPTALAEDMEKRVWELHGSTLKGAYRTHIKKLWKLAGTKAAACLLNGTLSPAACCKLEVDRYDSPLQ